MLRHVQGKNLKPLSLPPGPNGPVGNIWIGLSKKSFGIHGTPNPSAISKTASHGCIRLTNWDANDLGKKVKSGVTVKFFLSYLRYKRCSLESTFFQLQQYKNDDERFKNNTARGLLTIFLNL